jgi:hypothetical protein
MITTFPMFKRLPLDLRIKIYKYVHVRDIHKDLSEMEAIIWGRTIILSGILNDIDALELASLQGEQQREIICPIMALLGNLQALQWARRRGVPEVSSYSWPVALPWDWKTCANAAKGGHLHILQWLHEQHCPWNQETCENAAARGDLVMLTWLHQHHCPWDDYTYSMAAANGHLHVVQWLYENQCPWNERTFAYAAAGGNLHVLQWLYDNKCPWNEDTCCTAIAYGHYKLFEWAKSHGCPAPYGL